MILPIIAYGDPLLRKVATPIDETYPDLDKLIEDMFETMYEASGVGLAAPQVGKSIRLFIVDAEPFAEDEEGEDDPEFTPEQLAEMKDFKRVFINARLINETGKEWGFKEGCLSIPHLRENVDRKAEIEIEYYDRQFKKHVEKFDGMIARVIQHEYDHLEGILFTDKISPFKRKMLAGKLADISNGKITADYKLRYYKPKGK